MSIGINGFKRITKDTFKGLSKDKKIEYLQSWYVFVVSKAKGCTQNIAQCTEGVSALNGLGNTVSVTYYKGEKEKDKKPDNCIVAPSVNYGIRKIVSDKPASGSDQTEGRTYTITYGSGDATHKLTLRRGDRGPAGSTGEWGLYFKNGMKAIDPSVTGFSASFKVFSPSVTAIDGGLNGLSISINGISLKTGALFFCRTWLSVDNEGAGNKITDLNTRVVTNEVNDSLGKINTTLNNVSLAASEKKDLAMQAKVKGLQTKVTGLSLKIGKAPAIVIA